MPRHGALYRPARTHHQRRDPQALHPPESRRHVRRWSRNRQPLPTRRYRQTGDLTPRTSPGRPSALNEYQAWVEQSLISNDLTHDQRCDLLFDEIGVRISRATRCRWVQRLGSTRKKDELRQ